MQRPEDATEERLAASSMISKTALLGVGRGSLSRNAVAGALATLTDFALVTTLVSRAGISPPIATLWGCGLGGLVNFGINRSWSFASSTTMPSAAMRYALVSASSALLNSGGVALLLSLVPRVSAPYQAVWWLVRGVVFACFNYPLHRRFVFAHRDS